MSEDYWDMETVPLDTLELERLKTAMAVLMGTHAALTGHPCFYLWTEATDWRRTFKVCGCGFPRVVVQEVIG